MSFETDQAEATELVLFADNTYGLYQRKRTFTEASAKKAAAGVYDPAQAPKLWAYYAEDVVRAYDEDANGKRKGTGSLTIVPKKVRDLVARHYAAEFEAEVEAGEHDALIASLMTKKRKKELGLA